MEILNFTEGDEVEFNETFFDDSPAELWHTSAGCPPIQKGESGIVKEVSDNSISVKVLNRSTKTDTIIFIQKEDIDCLKIINKH